MVSVRVDVEGLSVLRAALGTLESRITQEVAAAVEEEAAEVVADAQAHVRVDSGDLRDSIRAEVSGMSAEVGPFDADPFMKAMVNEFGRKSDPGKPYMLPAAEASRARWPDRAGEAVKRGAGG